MKRFEDGDVITHPGKVAGTCKSCRARTDHGYLLVLPDQAFGKLRLDACLLGSICHEPLEASYRDSLTLDASDALCFALCLLRAYTAADSGKGGRLGDDAVCTCHIAFLDFRDESRDVYVYRASLDAARVLTGKAARSLRHCFFHVVSEVDLVEISRAYGRILLGYGDFLHYIYIHIMLPP